MSVDYTGRIFGYLKVKSKNDDGTYKCECECGNMIDVSSNDLRHHVKMSCGCKKQGSILLPRICRQCGKTFDGGPRAWYCPDCRYLRQLESGRKSYYKQTHGLSLKIGSIMTCEMCGESCIRNSANQRFCEKCAIINIKNKDRQQSLDYYKKNKAKINERRYKLRRKKDQD